MDAYWICVFGQIPLSVLWRVLCEYWMCVFGKVSLSVLLRVLGEYWMCIWYDFVECFMGGYWMNIGCVYWVRFR